MSYYIPYSKLKSYKRAYKIMLLHDQQGESFADIAKKYLMTTSMTKIYYFECKCRQLILYLDYIEYQLGRLAMPEIKKDFMQAQSFYFDVQYTCTYLEQEYKEFLDKYEKVSRQCRSIL